MNIFAEAVNNSLVGVGVLTRLMAYMLLPPATPSLERFLDQRHRNLKAFLLMASDPCLQGFPTAHGQAESVSFMDYSPDSLFFSMTRPDVSPELRLQLPLDGIQAQA